MFKCGVTGSQVLLDQLLNSCEREAIVESLLSRLSSTWSTATTECLQFPTLSLIRYAGIVIAVEDGAGEDANSTRGESAADAKVCMISMLMSGCTAKCLSLRRILRSRFQLCAGLAFLGCGAKAHCTLVQCGHKALLLLLRGGRWRRPSE